MLDKYIIKIEESKLFNRFIVGLIIINAVILGLDTDHDISLKYRDILDVTDRIILYIFITELVMRLIALKATFFKDSWCWFDLIVVSVSYFSATQAYSVLRTLRVLRVLRLISAIPRLRRVVHGFVAAIPGVASIGIIMILVLYIFAVMGVKLFGEEYPQWFGSLARSLFSLFGVMTLEAWVDLVRTIMITHPYAWVFFVTYIMSSTYTVMNLFIAVIIEAMTHEDKQEEISANEIFYQKIILELRNMNDKIDNINISKGSDIKPPLSSKDSAG